MSAVRIASAVVARRAGAGMFGGMPVDRSVGAWKGLGMSLISHLSGTRVVKRFVGFKKCERGAATVDAVLWLPAFFAVLCLITDTALIFNGQTMATRVVHDANRLYSVNRLQTTDQVKPYIEASLSVLSPHAKVDVTEDSGAVFSQVRIPSRELAATGIFTALTGSTVTVRASHMIEY